MNSVKFSLTFVLLMACLQGVNSAEFLPSFVVTTAQELSALITGQTAQGTFADGTAVQSKYGADGTLTASAPSFSDAGRWRVEDGRICGSLRKLGEFCNDARLDSGSLYLRRKNGEIVRYEVK